MGTIKFMQELSEALQKFQEVNFLCDAVITVGGKKLWMHSIILAAASPSLCSKFLDFQSCQFRFSLDLNNCDGSAVEAFVRFLYTGQLILPLAFKDSTKFATILQVCNVLGVPTSKLKGVTVAFQDDPDNR